jgi:hypothetical protein
LLGFIDNDLILLNYYYGITDKSTMRFPFISFSIALLLLFLVGTRVHSIESCRPNLTPLADEILELSPLDRTIKGRGATIAAHGKNSNIAVESSWANMKHAILEGDGHLSMLEIDAMMTKDGRFVIMHDPTFHRLVKDYHTPQHLTDRFRQNYPDLARSKEGAWDFHLFDESTSYTMQEIKQQRRLFDPNSGLEFEFIALDELLDAVKVPGEFRIPKHRSTPRAPPANQATAVMISRGASPEVVRSQVPLSIYIDFKPLNNYTRRLYGLSDWHWIRNSWSNEKLHRFTEDALTNLSRQLGEHGAHDRTFIAVRHPKVAKMAKQIDPKINLMASPDTVTKEMSAGELITAFIDFNIANPKIIEIKYLNHLLDPKVRQWAKSRGYKILYNQIEQTDPGQFMGIYQDNLPRLLDDILGAQDDIILQTNTVKELNNYLGLKSAKGGVE